MSFTEYEKLAINNMDIMCYIVDLCTYELLYANNMACATFSPLTSKFVKGKKCYDFLHGKTAPCDICNNHLLQAGQKLRTEIINKKNLKYYTHIDSVVEHNGKKVKLTLAYDASDQKEEIELLSRKISLEETLIQCIQTLIEDTELDKAITKLLSIVCQYYDADRAYLFEVDQQTKTAENTHEWCINPEFASIEQMPILSFEELAPILTSFEECESITIEDVEKLDKSSALYKVLHETKCKTVQIVPIYSNGIVTYFMGVDNSKRFMKDLTLLRSVLLFVVDDIKKDKIMKQLEHLSYTDILTGLSNRNKYLERLEDINISKLSSLGYVHVNINALKRMNELYGEKYGDNALKQVAEILSKYIKSDLFRISGDEFIALCPDIGHKDFESLISKLRKEEQENTEFTFAVGGVWQDKKIDLRQGLTQANDIMYSEKQNFYKAQKSDKVQSRLNPVEIILDEIRAELFLIYLQPKVDLVSGKIASAEALVRKHGRNGKIISPDRFVPIYENEGTIRHLDLFVLSEVCQLLQEFISQDIALPIAVNFSRVSFIGYDIIDEIVKICESYKVPHHYIKIELTESIDKMDFEFFHKKITELKGLGFEISLDDFGAKHSNLLMLTMAEFSEVKIDKGLIDNITVSAENRTVVRNIIKTIKELRKSACVAEGIETIEQVLLLQDFDCTYGQGYYFYRPMPISEFVRVYEISYGGSECANIKNKNRKNFIVNYDELYSAIEAMPLCMNLWDHKNRNIMCNKQVIDLFRLESKDEYIDKFFMLSPEMQPDGRTSIDAAYTYLKEARTKGYARFNWMHCRLNGEEVPCELTLVRLDVKSEDSDFLIAGYTRDLTPQLAGTDGYHWANEYFFNEVSDKMLFNTISEIAAEFFWVYNNRLKTIQFFGRGKKMLNLPSDKMEFPQEIIDKMIVPSQHHSEFTNFVQAMKEGRHYPVEVEFNMPDGSVRFFKIDYKTIYNKDNKPLFSIGKTSDIHDKKQLELLLLATK